MKSFLSLSAVAFLLILTSAAAAQTTFTNSTAIPIGDGTGTTGSQPGVGNPYPSKITVSGMTGAVSNIKVTINSYRHTWPDDVGMLLVAPNGAKMVIWSDVGGANGVSGLNISLDDAAASYLSDAGMLSSGTFKPTSVGDDDMFPLTGATPPPSTCETAGSCPQAAPAGTATFASVFNGIDPNGEWRLYTTDCCGGDTGAIEGGWSITITTSPVAGVRDVPVDMNGDGRTDWAIVRNTGGGTAGQVTWYVAENGGAGINVQPWGVSTDFFVPADFDGDGKDDYAIWRPGSQGMFYILTSGSFTVLIDPFGTTGDDPTVVGDYNGDGKDDVAVYREGATTSDPSVWYYRTAPNTNFYAVNFGQGGDFPVPGDYDGDGTHDFVVQRAGDGNVGIYYKLLSTGSYQVEQFGNSFDVTAPGDYDGDGKTDICTVGNSNGSMVWSYEPSSLPGTTVVTRTWGVSATDFPVPGDYDGDGKYDFAVWRNTGTFYVMSSGTGAITIQNWGTTNDYPVAN